MRNLIYIFLFCSLSVFSQNITIDSLKLALKNAKHDTTKCNILYALAETASEQEWPEFNDLLFKLTKKKLNQSDLSNKEYLVYKKGYGAALNNKGFLTNIEGDNIKALEYYKQSLKIQEEINNQSGMAACLCNIGIIYQKFGDFPRAIYNYNKSAFVFEKIGDIKSLITTLNSMGGLKYLVGDYKSSLQFYNKSLNILIRNKQLFDESSFINNSIIIHQSLATVNQELGNISKALWHATECLEVSKKTNNKDGQAKALNLIGIVYFNQGDFVNAIKHFDISLKIREELGDKKSIAESLNNIGVMYRDQGDYSKALEYYTKSWKIYKEIKDRNGIANALNNLGGAYLKLGILHKALYYFENSLKLNLELGNQAEEATSLNNIGVVYEKQEDLDKAKEYYLKSLSISERIHNKKDIIYSLNYIGGVYFKQKNYSKAIAYCNKSLNLSQNFGYPEQIRNASENLANIYRVTGNYKLSLLNYETYIKMRDSLINLETQKATIKQQTQYEYNQKKALEDERHEFEIKKQEDKAAADKFRQNIIIVSVSIVLILVGLFSILLYNRFKTTKKQKHIIEIKEKETQQQKHIIEEKQKEILDSINYAKRIQYTLLAHTDFLNENIPNNFVYFNPKDIVSGDFYWAAKKGNKFYLAVCDSTGHGVPGAFMCLLNIGFLSEAINEKGIEKPNEVFNFVRQRLIDNISKEGQKDGFDGILICIDQANKQITYAAANNNPILIQNKELIELEADRMPVGMGERKEEFKLHRIDMKPGDTLYLYTDGYADQFGGPKGKKFKYKQLNELLLAIHKRPLSEQNDELKKMFENWRGDLEQVDDVCVIGIRI